MILIMTSMACGVGPARNTRPPQVPAEAAAVAIAGDDVTVRGTVEGKRDDLFEDLINDSYAPLLEPLKGARQVWISAPANTEWLAVRKLVQTSLATGDESLWLSVTDTPVAYGSPRELRGDWASSCPQGPVPIAGADRAFTFEVHRGSDGVWGQANVRFRPILHAGAAGTDSLPGSCWKDASCAVLSPASRAACEAVAGDPAHRAPRRLNIGGAVGCLLPLGKAEGDLDSWPPELVTNLELLGIGASDDVMLIPEATAPWDAAVALLAGFAAAGQPLPTFGQPLVEGNDGPPLCTAPLRSKADIDVAMGRWFAQYVATAPAP